MSRSFLVVQHEAQEGPGYIEDWFKDRSYHYSFLSPQSRSFPTVDVLKRDDITGIIILGGSMNVKDRHDLDWLEEELSWLTTLTHTEIPLLGICLGSQLLSKALGGEVKELSEQEKGWKKLELINAKKDFPFPDKAFLSHYFHFTIPPNSEALASSAECEQQAFIFADHILGMQFHLEWTSDHIQGLFGEAYVDETKLQLAKKSLFEILDKFFINN